MAGSRLIGLCMLALATALPTADQVAGQVMEGHLRDAATQAPVSAALVQLLGSDGDVVAAARTAGDGAFRVEAPAAGTFHIGIQAVGYAREVPGTVTLGDGVTRVVLHASVEAVRLEGITVEAEAVRSTSLQRAGFYDRMRVETGRFFDRDEIEEQDPRRVTDLLRRIAGVRVVQSGNHTDVILRGGNMTGMNANQQCFPEVYLDGQLVSRGGPVGQGGFPRYNLSEILPANLEGIEVYASASRVPSRFGGAHASCGVVLFWSRAGR